MVTTTLPRTRSTKPDFNWSNNDAPPHRTLFINADSEADGDIVFLPESRRAEFSVLVARWRAERPPSSFERDIAMHDAYQRIISMGDDALPLILDELSKHRDHWFWALKVITGEDPVPEHSRGRLQEMTDAWLRWGEDHGYLPRSK